MKKPYVVLGRYVPKHPWRAWRVGSDIAYLTKQCGLAPLQGPPHKLDKACTWYSPEKMAGVRRRTSLHGQGEDWHQDGDTTPGAKMAQGVVLWASNHPTEFKFKGGEFIYYPEPFEVVLIRNLDVYHRRPPEAPRVRWTFRQRVELPHA